LRTDELEFTRSTRARTEPTPSRAVRLLGLGRHWRDALRRRMLATADLVAGLLVCVSIGLLSDNLHKALWAATTIPLWIVLAKLHGLYDRDHRTIRHLSVDEFPTVALWSAISVAVTSGLLALTPSGSITVGQAVAAWCVAAGSTPLLRGLARLVWRRITPAEHTLIIGDGPLVDAVRRKLELFPDIHADVTGQIRTFTPEQVRRLAGEALDGINRIIVASTTIDENLIAELVGASRANDVKLSVIPPRGMFGTAVQLRYVADLPVIEYNTWDISWSTALVKRTLDLAVAGVSVAVCAPLFALIALAIRLGSSGPILFVQPMAGRDGAPFRIYKFRTMVADAERRLSEVVGPIDSLPDPMLWKTPDDPRITRVGRLLRRTSLDELPQLVNVIKGDMSLVGPRPERPELVARYEPEHRVRLQVRPGLTGPMQVYGRAHLTFEERLAVDREYVENLSLGRDLRILALTVPAVFSRRGAY
jgi:exopolysaccharide biosynthesis polyprenyl glycosylphosphotransferase